MQNYNRKDQSQWDQIFQSPNPAWRNAPEQAFMRDALDLFKSLGAKTVLDIGCGVGIWSVYLARHGFQVYGADFSANAIQICRDWAQDENLKISFETAAITEDPFPQVSFDAVVASLIFENVSKKEMAEAILLLSKKLKTGGVIFSVFNPDLSKEQKEELLKKSNNPTKGITSESYSDEEIKIAFPDFKLISFQKYPIQDYELRAIALQRC